MDQVNWIMKWVMGHGSGHRLCLGWILGHRLGWTIVSPCIGSYTLKSTSRGICYSAPHRNSFSMLVENKQVTDTIFHGKCLQETMENNSTWKSFFISMENVVHKHALKFHFCIYCRSHLCSFDPL